MEEQTEKKERSTKDKTMSLIEHLDELRTRLIRFFIVLTLCVLACYAFRKEILNVVRSPIDVPLKKYTSTTNGQNTTIKKNAPLLSSYDCVCDEISSSSELPTDQSMERDKHPPASDARNSEPQESTSDLQPTLEASTDASSDNLVPQSRLESGLSAVKETLNDFFMFFQVMMDKEPSPLFSSEVPDINLTQKDANPIALMPGQIHLNCQCHLKEREVTAASSGSTMVFIGLPELFFAQMKVAIFAGFFLAFPYMLIELWGFIGPALYRGEKRVFWIFSIFSYLFFIGGALFGYFVVFPFGFDFFLSLTQLGEIMPSLSIGEYLGFAIKLLIAFGVIFEMPLVTFILARLGILTPEIMIKHSRVAVLVVFILSAVLTPPDPFTMMLMAGPLLLLYILSIAVCFVGVNRKKVALRRQGIEVEDLEDID